MIVDAFSVLSNSFEAKASPDPPPAASFCESPKNCRGDFAYARACTLLLCGSEAARQPSALRDLSRSDFDIPKSASDC